MAARLRRGRALFDVILLVFFFPFLDRTLHLILCGLLFVDVQLLLRYVTAGVCPIVSKINNKINTLSIFSQQSYV